MAYIYFPGCKYTAHSPQNSKKLQTYLSTRFQMKVTGCCSIHYQSLSKHDTAIFVCPTCSAILQESAPQTNICSIWEILAGDPLFPWPDYQGKAITIQDCWRTYDNREMQDAIRTVLDKMNFEIVEIDASYEKADFCGASLLKPPSPRYEDLAPVRFLQNAGGHFHPHTEEAQKIKMQTHCKQYQTDLVGCYCTGCLEGIEIGGWQGIHIMDLVMDSQTESFVVERICNPVHCRDLSKHV